MPDSNSTTFKRCSKCKREFPATLEYFSLNGKWLRSDCRECERERQRKQYHTPVGKERNRRHEEKRRTDPEMRARRKAYRQEYGKKLRAKPEYKAYKKEHERRRRQKPEFKEHERQKWAKPEYKEKRRERYRRSWANPEYRERTLRREREHRLSDPDYRERQNARERDRYRSPRVKQVKREYEQRAKSKPEFQARRSVNAHNMRARKRALPNNLTSEDWRFALDYFGGCCAVCGKPPGLWHVIAQEHWIPLSDPRPENPGTVATNIIPMCHTKRDGENGCNNTKSNRSAEEWLFEKFGKRKAKQIMRRIEDYFNAVRGRTL